MNLFKSIISFIICLSFYNAFGQNDKAIKHHQAGEEALIKGSPEEAMKAFNKAIEADENATWSYVSRANMYAQQDDLHKAIEDYSKAITLEPELALIYEYRGNAYSQGIDYNKAISDYTKAIESDLASPVLFNNRGYCYILTRKYEEAINDCSMAIELDSNYLLAYGSRGWAYYMSTEYQKSLEDLTIAMKIDHRSENYAIILDHYTKATLAAQGGMATASVATQSLEKAGRYFALIIGNNKYQDPNMNSLDQPIKDATRLMNVLSTQYTFERDNIIFLKNATRADIIESMDELSQKLTASDNLVIFYAGHGHWDKEKETGFWLPVDANKDKTTNWIRNSAIQDYMDEIPAQHTLLIADACFGGGIFKTRAAFEDAPSSIENIYSMPSRKGITSGMLNEVPDKSVFMEFLVKRLEQNPEKYLTSMDLYTQFRQAVMNNSENVPQYGTIHNAGDEGGDFVFVKR